MLPSHSIDFTNISWLGKIPESIPAVISICDVGQGTGERERNWSKVNRGLVSSLNFCWLIAIIPIGQNLFIGDHRANVKQVAGQNWKSSKFLWLLSGQMIGVVFSLVGKSLQNLEQLGNYKIPDHLGFSLTPGIKCLGSEGHSIGSTNRCIVSFRFLNSIDPVVFSLYQVYMLIIRLCLYTRWWYWSDFGREQSPYTSRRSVSGPEGNLALFSWKREVKNAAKLPALRGLFSLFGAWGGPLSAWKQQRDFLCEVWM